MNIDKGLKKLVALARYDKIKVPSKLSIIDNVKKDYFEELLKGAKLGISIYIALPHEWDSGSVLDYRIKSAINSSDSFIIKKHSMKNIQQVEEFLWHGHDKLFKIFSRLNNSKISTDCRFAPIIGSYQSWNDEQVDYSVMAQVQINKDSKYKSNEIFIAIDKDNPNGWAKNFIPKYKLYMKGNKKILVQNELNLPDTTYNEIVNSIKYLSSKKFPIDNFMIEGKVFNNRYQTSGFHVTDLYEGYRNDNPLEDRMMTHDETLELAIKYKKI